MNKYYRVNSINKEMFTDIVLYTVSEPGAMGMARAMFFLKRNGESFSLVYGYGDNEIPYSEIEYCFPALKGCYFNGPIPGEETEGEIILNNNINKKNETKVSQGWQHIYGGAGNHLLVRDDYNEAFRKCIKELKTPSDIFCCWYKHIEEFINEINKDV